MARIHRVLAVGCARASIHRATAPSGPGGWIAGVLVGQHLRAAWPARS